jgi:hypothetical protein
MSYPIITVDNHSSVVKDVEVNIMVTACNNFLPHVAQAWNIPTPHVVFSSNKNEKLNWNFHIVDTDPTTPDALAYHTEENDKVDGYILAKTILENGGHVLYLNNHTPTVASALFHEILEALIDPLVNTWWFNSNNGFMYAAEIADPVEGNIVPIQVHNVTVGLSDFVYPSWRDPESKGVRYNYMNTLQQPFTVDKGGYVVILDPSHGYVNYFFGNEMKGWTREIKMKHSKRNYIRVTKNKLTINPKTVETRAREKREEDERKTQNLQLELTINQSNPEELRIYEETLATNKKLAELKQEEDIKLTKEREELNKQNEKERLEEEQMMKQRELEAIRDANLRELLKCEREETLRRKLIRDGVIKPQPNRGQKKKCCGQK